LRPDGAQIARRRRIATVAGAVLASGSLALGMWVGAGTGGDDPVPEASVRQEVERRTSFLARLIPPAPEGARAGGPPRARSVSDLAFRLPLDRKVAQLLLLGFRGQDLTAPIYAQLRRLDLGGIVLTRRNYLDVQRLGLQAGEALVISQQERHVPPFVIAAQAGGEFNAFADLPPPNAPIDVESAAQGRREAADSAATLKPLGVSGVFAPSLDVAPSDDPVLGPRSYSDDPREVAAFARATVDAYRRGRMLAAATHFPGLGSASPCPGRCRSASSAGCCATT
jgi:beta-N-acetylhexosaminidase